MMTQRRFIDVGTDLFYDKIHFCLPNGITSVQSISLVCASLPTASGPFQAHHLNGVGVLEPCSCPLYISCRIGNMKKYT